MTRKIPVDVVFTYIYVSNSCSFQLVEYQNNTWISMSQIQEVNTPNRNMQAQTKGSGRKCSTFLRFFLWYSQEGMWSFRGTCSCHRPEFSKGSSHAFKLRVFNREVRRTHGVRSVQWIPANRSEYWPSTVFLIPQYGAFRQKSPVQCTMLAQVETYPPRHTWQMNSKIYLQAEQWRPQKHTKTVKKKMFFPGDQREPLLIPVLTCQVTALLG